MKYAYSAILTPEEHGYSVTFPDLPDCYTCGDDLPDALFMAEDALSGYLARAEELHRSIPAPSHPDTIQAAKGDIITLVCADTEEFRRRNSEKAVKKTLSIPAWLNYAAEAREINFSRVLQDALKHELGLGC